MGRPYNESVFAQALKNALDESGLSQQALADAVGVGQQTVSKWVTGLAMPRPEKIDLIETALDVPDGKLRRAAGYTVIVTRSGPMSKRDIRAQVLDMEIPALLDTLEIVAKELRTRLSEDSSWRVLRAAYDAEAGGEDERVEAITKKIKSRRGLK